MSFSKFLVLRNSGGIGASETLVIRVDSNGNEHVLDRIHHSGPFRNNDYLWPSVEEASAAGINRVILDLKNIFWVDSGGFGLVLDLLERIKKLGGDLVLVNVAPRIVGALEMAKLDYVLKRYASVEEAVASMSKRPGENDT
jgi:anti-anti-sigma factor